jgi:hypothetical protein
MAVAQDLPSLIPKIESAVKDEVPQYKLVRNALTEKGNQKDKAAFYQWGTRREGVSLSIFQGVSQEEAAQMIKDSMNHLSVGPDKKLNGLGNEAYLWIAPNGYGSTQFRKGKVYVTLSATTVAMAERVARRIAAQIPKE